ncbi:MAG: TetR/AcrR family transcriptional regulator C-terminal domain-containing protein [Nocardioides sp.]|uniref:TetR/AcrR family transcriptional regulator C-terminal domain-containing protein n=1 Tax=Nocardioides sp. TaxID=35761 RepID=UPI003F03DFF2
MSSDRAPRNTLSRDRVVAAAVALADTDGLPSLTIRALATALAVKPMAIYHHVRNKEALLDALVDHVFSQVRVCRADAEWRQELGARAASLRAALNRHPWALTLMEARKNPGPATLANHEAALDLLRTSGFSLAATAHAYAVVDAFVYGFALQEAMLDQVELAEAPGDLIEGIDMSALPRMAEFATQHVMRPGYSFGDSFEVGLGMVLDGIAALA